MHLQDEWSFLRKLAARLRQEAAILILATLIAILALIEGINTAVVFWIWMIAVIVALTRAPLIEKIEPQSPAGPAPQ